VQAPHLTIGHEARFVGGLDQQAADRLEPFLGDVVREELTSAGHEVCNHAQRICDS
jgi:hypothetical protein